ncbi:MAG: ATP synthase F1 subunit delta [Candidatus Rokuibacteriota bacterium]|nr:MAG: ATP synthase F1 subunit delta [Candidatus Rokubacteria bacterium]
MKTSPAVAKSYAKAIFELARERDQADQLEAELARIGAFIGEDGELATVLSQPWVTPANKRKLAEELGQRLELSKLGRDVLALVAAHGRADHLRAIATAYRGMLDAAHGRVRARVRTAVPLTDGDRTALTAKLSSALESKQVVLDEVTDRSLLGGFVAEIGSLIVDGSLDGQLARLRHHLARG